MQNNPGNTDFFERHTYVDKDPQNQAGLKDF